MTFRDWLDWAEPLALGELDLRPWEFWRLTPKEFLLTLDGFARREDRALHHTGQLGVWILSPHTKKRLTVEKLVGRRLSLLPKAPGT